MLGGCIIVHKLTLGFQYKPGSRGKGVVNAPSVHTRAMASCKGLAYAIANKLQVVEKTFQEASCKTAQRGQKKAATVRPRLSEHTII